MKVWAGRVDIVGLDKAGFFLSYPRTHKDSYRVLGSVGLSSVLQRSGHSKIDKTRVVMTNGTLI